MRNKLIVLSMLLGAMAPASAQQVSIGMEFSNVSIGINLPLYPDLEPMPGYPVYYAPGLDSNYFFYDGMYWVYQGDNWYASSWYNGPWGMVSPEFVPLFVLRIPVRYYRQPPAYFRGWLADAPPRWGEHWGNEWAQRRSGWDRWNRRSTPAPSPLPVYQQKYSGNQYPRVEQQKTLQSQNYHYKPRDPDVRKQSQAQRVQSAAAPAQHEKQGVTQENNSRPQGNQSSKSPRVIQQSEPGATHAPQPEGRPVRQQGQQPEQKLAPREQLEQREVQRQPPAPQSRTQETERQGNEAPQESRRERRSEQDNDRRTDNNRGQDRGR